MNTKLITAIGNITVTVTDGGDHIYACSNAMNVDPLVVNGVEYYFSVHLWHTDTGFAMKEINAFGQRVMYADVYMSRWGHKTVSYAAKKKAVSIITNAVNDWIKQDPQILLQAKVDHIAAQRAERVRKVNELRAQIAALEDELVEYQEEA